MALQKTPVSINFGQGLETKQDPYQVQVGKFLTLVNSVFTTGDRLTKRNGFAEITSIANASTLTTFGGNLIATGSDLSAYYAETKKWYDKGTIQPVQLNTIPLVRVSTSQSSQDTANAISGSACVVYMDNGQAYYHVTDSVTGQQIINRTALPSNSTCPRVFTLGNYFVITFINGSDLKYFGIPFMNPTNPTPTQNFATNVASSSAGYDGYVVNNSLFIAYAASGNTVRIGFISTALLTSSTSSVVTTGTVSLMTVTADTVGNTIFISYYNGTNIYTAAFNYVLVELLAPTVVVSTISAAELTSVANGGLQTIFYQVINDYGYDSSIRTDYISSNTCTLAGTVGTPRVVLRSVGLASKSFMSSNNTIYMMATYGNTAQSSPDDNSNQPTYFLIDSLGNIYMRLNYSNGGGYTATQVLPSVTILNNTYYISYLANDFLASVNKSTNPPSGTRTNAIYTQTGVNLSTFSLNTNPQYSSEIAGVLNLTGGQLWMYDGVKPVEQGFQVWPENVESATATGSGSITAGTYNYVFTYEWTDNKGNLHRSAPSIPIVQITTTASSTNTIHVPTDRLTYKVAPNPIRIVGYRWSVAQQIFYQFTSLSSPTLNDPTIDYVTFTDTQSDAEILGNTVLYTTGGVLENIAPPASIASALFKNRLFIVDAEDQNLLWYSKQVIEAVPVEMSDLLTLYVAPTSGAQGSTGPITALSAMDDKLIVFKRDAIYYITGTGPDNTGANNDFSDPIFITGNVGCANQNSIVLMPNGLMFQSDKGIWLLGRDLSTSYIGAPVEQFNSFSVENAKAIPGTNQVRFILSNNTMLMFDYYYNQWGTFTSRSAISATLYNNTHTYLNSFGQVFQETPGSYIDGSSPVLMSFTSAWINIAGLQGFERFYFLYLLGTYFTPFTLDVGIAYNYNSSPLQSTLITPDNATPAWGGEAVWGAGASWGSSTEGGSSADSTANIFEARLFAAQQKCESFQISVSENYDSTLGIQAGQGLTLSGMNMIIGTKKGYRTQRSGKSFG